MKGNLKKKKASIKIKICGAIKSFIFLVDKNLGSIFIFFTVMGVTIKSCLKNKLFVDRHLNVKCELTLT